MPARSPRGGTGRFLLRASGDAPTESFPQAVAAQLGRIVPSDRSRGDLVITITALIAAAIAIVAGVRIAAAANDQCMNPRSEWGAASIRHVAALARDADFRCR
ncbi:MULTISPECIES: hypothetical protein [unclassified Lysobacter]|uniref:hypothetical protein n=1 Tax=unclassified Lysobacter TaxID=2635362 RepID=UPI001BEB4DF4|nr:MULTISPECIES: hypothetical protein [unclassified Lysobacter]MBT2749115.1 hypothetical protein [Lysobacter sp. ISL-42]MBT2754225.1 hypothetical protein [Lysobacter sp. ISL-50]MBT2779560.1 hypothetical protein [Lysobacter sp. ISL-54]MBT2784326.1 hypothetical protein [Lysobacter sp. ISL-52]